MAEPAGERGILKAAVILAATSIAYIPLVWAGFIWDDGPLLYESPWVLAPDGIYSFWFTTEAYEYFPVANSALWLEWRLFGMNAVAYHMVSVALHAMTSLIMWRVLLRLAIPGAWLIALVFAVHPVNVASVMWIAQRKSVLSLFFAAISAFAFLRSEDESSSRWYAWSLFCFAVALLSKTAVAALPVVLLGFVWWRRGSIRIPDLSRVLPFFVVSGALSLVTVYFQYTNGITAGYMDVVRPEGFASRLAGTGWAVWFYISKTLWPLNLAMVYPRWDIDAAQPLHWVPLVSLFAVFAVAWWDREKAGRAILLGLGCMIVMVSPVLGFFKMYFYRYSLVADHWQYPAVIAMIALVVGGATGLWRWRDRGGRLVGIVIAALIVMALGTLTYRQSLVYQSNLTLFGQNAAVYPRSAAAQYNLGLALVVNGYYEDAKAAYRQAISLDPTYAEAYYNIGELTRAQGDLSGALYYYEQATNLPYIKELAYYGQGLVLEGLGRTDEALIRYEKLVERNPEHEEARAALDRLLGDSPSRD